MLPMAVVVLVAAGRLLSAMDDAAGGAAVHRVALAGGIAWVIDLAALVVALGMNALGERRQ